MSTLTRRSRFGIAPGVLIALFIVYHLLHLTANTIHPGGVSPSPYERVVNGIAYGLEAATTTCERYMSSFQGSDVIDLEPWRAKPFPVIKDLVIDCAAFDRII